HLARDLTQNKSETALRCWRGVSEQSAWEGCVTAYRDCLTHSDASSLQSLCCCKTACRNRSQLHQEETLGTIYSIFLIVQASDIIQQAGRRDRCGLTVWEQDATLRQDISAQAQFKAVPWQPAFTRVNSATNDGGGGCR
ncbi:hypothetical protein H1C71_003404, partial [Ictidomys tridecemlineatus]